MKFLLQAWPFAFEFSAAFIIDVLCTRYTIAANERRAIAAAWWSAAWATVAAVSTLVWLHNNWVLIAGIFGAWFGTYYAVKYGKKETT